MVKTIRISRQEAKQPDNQLAARANGPVFESIRGRQLKQMAQIREHLAALEEGTEPNVIDV